MKNLTKKDLARKWGCSTRTVERDVRVFKLKPVDYVGIQPVWKHRDVRCMEARRKKHRDRQRRRGYGCVKGVGAK